MIDFTRAFNTAWERMVVILFQPFDPGKWFVIGLGAFLAGLLSGGNGANNVNKIFDRLNPSRHGHAASGDLSSADAVLHRFKVALGQVFTHWQTGTMIMIFLFALAFFFALVLVFYWLGSRGQFLLLDNIVRNRGAVSAPWENYSRQANSLFFFLVWVMAFRLLVFLPILGLAGFMAYPYLVHDRMPVGGEWNGLVAIGASGLVLGLLFHLLCFLFRELSTPIMFRQRCTAIAALVEMLKLVQRHPGNIALFVLLRFALALALWVMGALTWCCCCVGVIPYLGTVALLPALIFVRCFTLECLAQFGPEYDAWTVDVPPGGPGAPPAFSPLPPRG